MRAALIGAGPKQQTAIKRGGQWEGQREGQLGMLATLAVDEKGIDWQPAATLA